MNNHVGLGKVNVNDLSQGYNFGSNLLHRRKLLVTHCYDELLLFEFVVGSSEKNASFLKFGPVRHQGILQSLRLYLVFNCLTVVHGNRNHRVNNLVFLINIHKRGSFPIHELQVEVPNFAQINLHVDCCAQFAWLKVLDVWVALDCILHGSIDYVSQRNRVIRYKLVQVKSFAVPHLYM